MPAKTRTLEDVLRDVKDLLLCYSVRLEYGAQDMGLDDTGMPDDVREARIVAAPGGFLGGLRVVFQGTVESLRMLDLYAAAVPVGNPPERAELVDPDTLRLRHGAFVYGTPDAVQDWSAKLEQRRGEAAGRG